VGRVDGPALEERLRVRAPRRPGRAFAVGVLLLVLLALLGWRMVPHPVGPARTSGKYLGKAVTTARVALSDVETVLVVADGASKGQTFGPYTALVVSDSEEALSGVQGTFDSIQPPNAESDAVRAQLDDLLSQATGDVAQVRIAARRGSLPELAEIAKPLKKDARELQRFVERNS
jgi:hypothetical protein